jgi:anthranilate phosphoribosyltransferase
LNAAGALVVAGTVGTLKEGVALAAASVDEGKAMDRLEKLIQVSNG